MEYCFDNEFESVFDQAQLLYKLVGHRFVYVHDRSKKGALTKKGSWYELVHHEWKQTDGGGLRLFISQQMYELYNEQRTQFERELTEIDPVAEREASLRIEKKIKNISDRMHGLHMTHHKSRIMKEAMKLFYSVDVPDNPRILCLTVNPKKRALEELIESTFDELQSLLTSKRIELLEKLDKM